MKKLKIVLLGIIVLGGCLLLTGCNKQIIDTKYTFNRAIVTLNDGTRMEIEIAKWNDYEGEQLQIIGKDRKVYLVSSYNTILIKD
jgi:hypothetical protein